MPPFTDADLQALEALIDAVPAPLEPLDIGALDGYLAGVLLQTEPVPAARWLRYVHDAEGRPPAADVSVALLHAQARRRHAELSDAIAARRWFDPWVWELDDGASPSDAVLPWVAGFALAMDAFPGVMRLPSAATLHALATLYAALDPDDLEDADELLAEIETLEPPADMTEAVDGLVRSVLQLADVSRPLMRPAAPRRRLR